MQPDSARREARISWSRRAGRRRRRCTSPSRHLIARRWTRSTRRRLGAGGRDNGAPGLRSRYHPGYYAAYVLDPDGNNVEAVFHDRSVSS